jgi:chromosome segregation ATPase
MTVTAIRKNGDPRDPTRDELRAAIAACAAGHAKAEQHQEAIHRARNMLGAAEAKLNLAGEALEATRTKHASSLVQAAQSGTVPKGGTELRSSRQALADAEDEASASRAALDRLEADGDDLDASSPQLENAVLVAAAQVVASVAGQVLAQLRQKQTELAVLQQVFHALTDEQTTDTPVFGSDVLRLNARDARMKPVARLRDEFFALDSRTGQDRAREVAGAFRKWRTALARDPDAPVPEV